MRFVVKGAEPACLSRVRREVDRIVDDSGQGLTTADWSELKDCAQPVRDALAFEQAHLCAYCMGRLRTTGHHDVTNPSGMKIEHFVPRSVQPAQMFQWSNLLGVCSGRTVIQQETHDTCDRVRGNRPLHINPARRPPDPAACFSYRRDGTIVGLSPEAHDDIVTLNLNAAPLRNARAAAIAHVQKELRRDDTVPNLRRLHRQATSPNASGELPPYAGAVAAYVSKKLRARGIET